MVTGLRPVLVSLALGVLSCAGTIGGPGRSPGGDPVVGGGPQGGAGAGNGAPGAATPPAASCAAPWRTTTLTREQYINAASDLLGLDVRPLVTLGDVGGRKFVPGAELTA